MQTIFSNIKINVNEKIYLKDPESSELGKKIIENGIILIYELGFDDFTFKKLGEKIGSNESSIYRYFDNKYKLLTYLTSWYWGYLEYKLVFGTSNMTISFEKLQKAITIVSDKLQDDINTPYINEGLLHQIMVTEFTKTVFTKQVDANNSEGYFLVFKRVVYRLSEIINELKPEYEFAESLASTIIIGALSQQFLSEHLKSITNCNVNVSASQFYSNLVFSTLK